MKLPARAIGRRRLARRSQGWPAVFGYPRLVSPPPPPAVAVGGRSSEEGASPSMSVARAGMEPVLTARMGEEKMKESLLATRPLAAIRVRVSPLVAQCFDI
ncbi:hypothetical protein Dimus_028376, partial [Dionaea muscipula]